MKYNEIMFNNERFDFKIVLVSKLEFPASTRFSPARTYHSLIFRIRGKAEILKGDSYIRLNKNDVTFVPEGYEYNIRSITDEEVIVVHFEANFAKTPTVNNMHTIHPDVFLSLFDKLLVTWQNKPHGFVYRIDSLFLSILEQIELQNIEAHANTPLFRIQQAVDTMHANIADSALSVDSLARKSGYCLSYFRRVFNEEMGMSPKEYLISIRIRHAVSLLESGYYSVEEVAELSGFTGAKYFSTCFKRVLGKSPSDYSLSRRK